MSKDMNLREHSRRDLISQRETSDPQHVVGEVKDSPGRAMRYEDVSVRRDERPLLNELLERN